MLAVVLLGFGAAIFPALLACVAILLSRPRPRRLLLAFYLGGLVVSVLLGLVILRAFEQGHEVAGSTKDSPNGWVSIVLGCLGIALAVLVTRHHGSAKPPPPEARSHRIRSVAQRVGSGGKGWAEERLDGASITAALLVGVVINLPGPFYLLALGDIALGGYAPAARVLLILVFNLIMFVLVEIPLLGYLVDPASTEARVEAFARWLAANGRSLIAGFVALVSIGLVIQGIGAAA